MNEPRICAWHECGNPLVQHENEHINAYEKRQCCSLSCGAKLGNWKSKRSGKTRCPRVAHVGTRQCQCSERVKWPEVTGEIDWNNAFAAHNMNPIGYGTSPPRPDVQSYTGCSAAIAYAGGS